MALWQVDLLCGCAQGSGSVDLLLVVLGPLLTLRFRCRALSGPPKVPKVMAQKRENKEYRQYKVHFFGQFGGPGGLVLPLAPRNLGFWAAAAPAKP